MPALVRKLLIFAAADGLFLHRRGSDGGSVKIEYGTNRIVPTSAKHHIPENGLEAYGIIGLLDLVSSSYLISITRRDQVAQIRDQPVFRITDVLLIPLKSKEEAEQAINNARRVLEQSASKQASAEDADSSDSGDAAETSTINSVDTVDEPSAEEKPRPEDEAAALEAPTRGLVQRSSTFVKDVVQEQGKYGRFASKWFSRHGAQESVRRQEGKPPAEQQSLTREQAKQMEEALPDRESVPPTQEGKEDAENKSVNSGMKQQSAIDHLTPRLLRSARLYFSSSGFYFSYEHNLSMSLADNGKHSTELPLWERFDSLFFWNKHLMKPFIEAGENSLILPLIQGFVGQRAFVVTKTSDHENDVVTEASQDPQGMFELQAMGVKAEYQEKPPTEQNLLLTLVSRRSIKRAGLRYLRRGVDDDGNVANSVETEQILSNLSANDIDKTFSLLQLRGSIPLFFSQSPYSFKPMPVMFGSETTNQAAFKKHFVQVVKRYGRVQATSLIDRHGTELAIGEAYEKQARQLNDAGGVNGEQIGFEWFDFHGACKGMKFENVSILLNTLENKLASFGWTEKQNESITKNQVGILRTNCMDCLDRTNVVQSAVAGWALQQQLAELGLDINLQTDPKTQWFNTLWADNGDAISKQYAGTSALKGDFTRTRKRNWTGALSDFSLTLNRYYNNIFGDYFMQINIDYFLGNASPAVFDEFETDMMSQDYALDMRQVRQNAIDSCIKIVLEDPKEDLVAGWTLSCPKTSNTLRSLPFEECVLLLTDSALYFCRFNWETEKVGSFERICLLDIKEVWRGVYITSALGGTHLDESKNVGFALRYQTKGPVTIRTNTRSMSVVEGVEQAKDDVESDERKEKNQRPTKEDDSSRVLAFKSLPPRAVAAKNEAHDPADLNEVDMTKHICSEISQAMGKAWSRESGAPGSPPDVQEHDIISVAEAKRSTGYMESLGYNLKRLVWS